MPATDAQRNSVSLLMRALLDGPCSVKELTTATGMSRSTVVEWLRALRAACAVRIDYYTPKTREVHYALNPDHKADAMPPKPKSGAQLSRDYRARMAQRRPPPSVVDTQ